MLSDITIGQYFPGASILHRLDPRSKIVLLGIFILAVFVFNTPATYALLCGFTLLLIAISKLSWRMMLKSIKPLWWIILFTFLIHLCSTPGTELAKVWLFSLTREGLQQGIFISVRLILLILLSSLLTFTTSPLALTDALELLLGPFKRFGLPAHGADPGYAVNDERKGKPCLLFALQRTVGGKDKVHLIIWACFLVSAAGFLIDFKQAVNGII